MVSGRLVWLSQRHWGLLVVLGLRSQLMRQLGRGRHTFTVGYYVAFNTTFLADSRSSGSLGKDILSQNSKVRLVGRQCQHDQICVLTVSFESIETR
jgi:hypothetical protein